MSRPAEGVAEPAAAPARRWVFGNAVLDERALELRVAGESFALERKALEVLLHLLHHAGEVVTKDELLEAVWPGRILSESVLSKCIFKIREALKDDAQAVIKTVHGYGYRLVAPVQVEAAVAVVPPHFDFKAGDHPPQRPMWSLVERLGRGGHGEAWLARHDKTREQRVYKFALDGTSLPSLKREITLYRYLRDALGERSDLVRVLDWNLEEQPYFLELEYAGARNLVDWVEAQGGAAAVPLAVRLDVVARIADALAAAHSVGVLHKDLKPSNVLIVGEGTEVGVKVADFGSGGVLDPERLDALGITKLGFTRSTRPTDPSTTPLYVAPEIQAGQPATVQGDVYALGVMLYQLAVGDLKRPLASDWEHEVEDETLCEDIAMAVAGNPLRRLGDAARLARRLRTLDQRRRAREAEKAAQSELRSLRMTLLRKRARRRWVQATVALLLVGTLTTATLWVRAERLRQEAIDARNAALEAAAITQAVNDFLNKDLLTGANPWKQASPELKVREVLDSAAEHADERFADQPEVAAQILATVGETNSWLGRYEAARDQLERAAERFEGLHGRGSVKRLAALSELSRMLTNMGQVQEGCRVAQTVLADAAGIGGASSPAMLQARLMAARCSTMQGELHAAIGMLRTLIADAAKSPAGAEAVVNDARLWLMRAMIEVAEFEEAEKMERAFLDALARKYGEHHVRTALQRFFLGLLLTDLGRFEEAEVEVTTVLRDIRAAVGYDLDHRFVFDALLGNLRLQQGRLDEAIRILVEGRRRFLAALPRGHPNEQAFGFLLGEAYKRQGDYDRAIATLREVLAGPPGGRAQVLVIGLESIYARVTLADALRLNGDRRAARAELAAIPAVDLRVLPPRHPIMAELRRVEGLLALDEGRDADARPALAEARDIFEQRYGAGHWRTRRAARELAQAEKTRA